MIRIKNPNSSGLPNEYQEVEYIQSTGTQYIDTGYTPVNGDEIEIQHVVCSRTTSNQAIFSAGTGTYQWIHLVSETGAWSSSAYYKYFATGTAPIVQPENTLEKPTTVKGTSSGLYYNGVQVATSSYGGTVNTSIRLLKRANDTSGANAKIGRTTIRSGETVVRDMIPCYRLSDNVVGMYDLIAKAFHVNAGTGKFLIGTEVGRRDMNIKPIVGGKELLARYIEDKLIYQKVSEQGIFVCVGAGGKSYSSTDGLMWIGMSGLNTSYTYEGVAYGDGRFVCVGNKGSSYYSTDALTWTAMTGLTSKTFTNVAYGNGIFVCVGADGYSYYSTNGTSWKAITRLASDYIYGVTYGNDRFVCVGEGGLIYYSTTGKKWTKASGPYVTSLNSVTYGDGRFVCVGTQGKSYYSTDDGATWTSMSGLSTRSSYSSVTYGDGRFVCTGSAGRSYYSTNGTSWKAMSGLTAKDAYGDLSYDGVTYGNNRFVCVGINGYSFYSTDGLTWNAMSGLPNSTSADFYEVAYAEI